MYNSMGGIYKAINGRYTSGTGRVSVAKSRGRGRREDHRVIPETPNVHSLKTKACNTRCHSKAFCM